MTSVHVLRRVELRTPVGAMVALASNDGLAFLEFTTRERMSRIARRLQRWFAEYTVTDGSTDDVRQTTRWLDAYFSRKSLPLPRLDLRGTPFERHVWSYLTTVRWGSTTTYGDIATALGRQDAARAVGAANGANPVTLVVPCHRVVGRNGSLTGYGGGLSTKRWLLQHEGCNAPPSSPRRARAT